MVFWDLNYSVHCIIALRSPFGQPLPLSHVLVFSPQPSLRGNDLQEIESYSRGEPSIEMFMPTSAVTRWTLESMLLYEKP